MYVRVYLISMYVFKFVCMCVQYVCVLYVYVCVYSMYVRVCVHACEWACPCVCARVCACLCMCMCVRTHVGSSLALTSSSSSSSSSSPMACLCQTGLASTGRVSVTCTRRPHFNQPVTRGGGPRSTQVFWGGYWGKVGRTSGRLSCVFS